LRSKTGCKVNLPDHNKTNYMRITLVYAILVFLLGSCGKKEFQNSNMSGLESQVDSLVKPWLDSSKIAGLSVAVFRGDEKILLKSYGYADLEFDVKLPVDASFEIGSITKQFTAAAILQLAEKGKLGLDDDVTKYLNFNTHGRKVTIRQLLSHTSGIKGYTELPEFETISVQKHDRDTLLRIVETKPFEFEPGDLLIYSNTGFFMLGLIIEKVTGITYEEYIKKNLFEKAGMSNSYYGSESRIIKNRAHGYDMHKDGLSRAAYLDHTWPYSAGSLCSTAEDLVKWNNAVHNGKILSESMYREYISPFVLNNGTITRYAKGITVTQRNGKKMLEHAGGINGFLSENRYFPDEKISVVVLINSTGPVGPELAAQFITDKLFGEPSQKFNQYKGDLSRFTGKYKGPGRGEELSIDVTNNDSLLLIHSSERDTVALSYLEGFVWADGNVTFQFAGTGDSINELRIDNVYGYNILKKQK
jgi:CubicO group peptidase (beta-lactamase class C family)